MSAESEALAAHLARLSLRYVQARDEVTTLTRQRAALICEREWPPHAWGYSMEAPRNAPDKPAQDACWKATYEESGDGYRGGWSCAGDDHEDGWCANCLARKALHDQIRPAQRRMAARLQALILATRAAFGMPKPEKSAEPTPAPVFPDPPNVTPRKPAYPFGQTDDDCPF